MAYLSSRVILLTFLYFIQGLPYGLQARFLPVYLRSKGLSLTSLGFFKMLLAPWLCKALWAPLVDKYSTKQKWLLCSIFGLMVTCAVTSVIPPDNMILLCLCIFSLNLFAATQDIAVDSIALTILPPEELGKGNTAQVVGYKIGAIFGGGILVWFMDVLGWTGLFLAITLLYIEALLFVYLSPTLRIVTRLGVARIGREGTKPCQSPPVTDSGVIETKPVRLCKPVGDEDDSPVVEQGINQTKNCLDAVEQEDKTCNSVADIKAQNLSKLIKSALEFIETKDSLEKELEFRHKLKAEKLGSEKQEEMVKEIVDNFKITAGMTASSELPIGKKSENNFDAITDKSNTSTNESTEGTPGKCEQNSCDILAPNPQQNNEKQQETSNINRTDKITSIVKIENLESSEGIKSIVKNNATEVEPGENFKPIEKSEWTENVESTKKLKPPDDMLPVGEELGVLDHSDVGKKGPEWKAEEIAGDEVEEDEKVVDGNDELADGAAKECGDSEDSDAASHDSFTCSSVRLSSRFAFIWEVLTVPNTQWIVIYVLIYKLGEQGALGMLPLFLIDQDVAAVDVTFWTGVVGQATSMFGSCLGGWILSHPVYRLPCRLLIYQLSLCRMLPLGLLLWVVMLWSGGVISPVLLYRGAIASMNLLLVVSGMVTTSTFTLMMECSQQAPTGVQATHYTLLSSMEVFGKLAFMSVCGALVDLFGYTTMYLSFVMLSAALLPWLWRYPDILCEKKQV